MTKAKYYILYFFLVVFTVIEFVWSVGLKIVEAIGLKLNELNDALSELMDKTSAELKKAKS